MTTNTKSKPTTKKKLTFKAKKLHNNVYESKETVDKIIDNLSPTMLFEVGDFIKVGELTYKIISFSPREDRKISSKYYLVFRCKEYVLKDGVMTSVMSSPNKPYISIIKEQQVKGKFDYNTKYGFWEYKKR